MRQVPERQEIGKIRTFGIKTKKGISVVLIALALASSASFFYIFRPVSATPPPEGTVLADYCVTTDPYREGVGIGFDGTSLYYLDDPLLDGTVSHTLHKITGTAAGTTNCPKNLTTSPITIVPSTCNPTVISSADGPRFWAADGTKIYLMTVGATATCAFQFDAASSLSNSGLVLDCGKPGGCGSHVFVDGLNYDNGDNSLWYSPDASVVVYHFSVDTASLGQFLGSFRVDQTPNVLPGGIPVCTSTSSNDWSSGVGTGSDILYLSACRDHNIYKFSKDGIKVGSFQRKVWTDPSQRDLLSEDLECDSVTFKAQNTDALWERSTSDSGNKAGLSLSHIIAYAVSQGTCGFGGGFKGQKGTSTYTAKWICNVASPSDKLRPQDAESIGLVPGEYKTDINVYNPNPPIVFVSKQFVMSVPEPTQANALVNSSRTVTTSTLLGPKNAMFITCDEIQKLFQTKSGVPTAPQPQAVDATTIGVSCTPSTLVLGQASSCTATVTDTSATPITPTGTVSFASSGAGSFSGSPCIVSGGGGSASCSVTFTPSATGMMTIAATYPGDANHGGSSGSTSITVNQSSSPDYNITASPSVVNTAQGATGTSTISVTAMNGFTGTVSLTESHDPTGLRCALSVTSITGSGSSTLSCDTLSAGTFNVTVTGTSGPLSHSTIVTFFVQPPPTFTAKGFFVLTTSASNLDVVAEYSSESFTTNTPPFTSTGISLEVLQISPVTQTPVPCSPDFSITADPTVLNITNAKPTAAMSMIALTSFCNFAAPSITLSSTVTPSLSSPSVNLSTTSVSLASGGIASAFLKVNTSSSTAKGQYIVTIIATGVGVSHSTSVIVNVT